MHTLLLPCAGKSTRYPGVRPKWMLTTPEGKLAVQKAAESVDLSQVDRMVIAIRRDHDERFGAAKAIRRAFGDAIDIVVIDYDTDGPAETVSLMISEAKVSGSILVKDADSFFDPAPMPEGSFVATSDLRKCLDIAHVGAKSFITINENGLISQIAEKSVSSNFICTGLFAFSDADFYQSCLQEVRANSIGGEIFVSHVVLKGLARGEIFTPFVVEGLVDVGTLSDWQSYTANHRLYIVDIDGVVFQNQSEYFPPYWGEPVVPLADNINRLRQLQDGGAQLVFVTSRPEKYRTATMTALEQVGLRAHAVVMGASHAQRVLINDFAASNPYPSARAVNIPRNGNDLANYIP